MNRLKLYADLPARRSRQVAGDLLLVLWVALWIWLASKVHAATERLPLPGARIHPAARGPPREARGRRDAGGGLAGQLRDAGDAVGGVPFVGKSVSRPFDGAGGAADKLVAAGRAQVDA